jgi:hypothetical protein
LLRSGLGVLAEPEGLGHHEHTWALLRVLVVVSDEPFQCDCPVRIRDTLGLHDELLLWIAWPTIARIAEDWRNEEAE